VNNKFKN